ncbi:MAG: hypothetical protein H6719_32190 [Sandaracinaceae bacterium]|nr:hypothetical protein [Sandaracinaceae bacterium]
MTRALLLSLLLLAPSVASAQAVRVDVSGPRARMVERELTRRLEAAGVTVEDSASARVEALVRRRGRRGWATGVRLRDASGEEVVSGQVAHRRFPAMGQALGRWTTRTLAPAIAGLGAAPTPVAEAPAARPAARRPEPARAAPVEDTDTEVPDPPGGSRVPPFAFHLGLAVTHRALTYTDDIYASLRPYALPAAPFLRFAIEWFPGAHFDAGLFGGFSVVTHGQAGLGIQSIDGQGIAYPTEAWGFGIDVRYRLPVDDVVFGITAGYTTSTFALRDADELSPRPQVPNVEYHSLRAGGSFRWNVGLGIFLDVGAAYLYPIAAGEILSDAWFGRGEVGGLDGAAGVGLRIDDVELAGRFELQRFWYDMHSEPGDARVAGGAVDEYLSGVVSLVYTPSGL